MERLKILVIGTLMFTFGGIMSCGNVDHSRENGQEMVKQDTTVMQILFPFPAIPEVLTSPVDRKSYLLIHYWEQFDFADTMLVNNRDVTEQGFVNFIALLADGTTPEELTRESLENWCAGFVGKDHARKVLTQTADDYLFNPNSPFYNEGLYGMYLEALLGKLPQTDAMRSAYRFKLELVKRNNVGDKATDFTYYQPDGMRRTLVTTSVKNDRLLLMFYDPECESCHEVLLQMAADTALAERRCPTCPGAGRWVTTARR